MMPRVALDAVADFAERLRARFAERVAWVRVYGSYARGEAREDSDVDVAAVVRGLTWREKVEAIDLAADVSLSRAIPVSAVVMSDQDFERLLSVESPFAENIMREGVAA